MPSSHPLPSSCHWISVLAATPDLRLAPRLAWLLVGALRRTPERGDQAGDGRRVGPDRDPDDQTGGQDDLGGGLGDHPDGDERRGRGGLPGLVPPGQLPPPGEEPGLAHPASGAERPDGLPGRPLPQRWGPARTAHGRHGCDGRSARMGLLTSEKALIVHASARRPATGRLRLSLWLVYLPKEWLPDRTGVAGGCRSHLDLAPGHDWLQVKSVGTFQQQVGLTSEPVGNGGNHEGVPRDQSHVHGTGQFPRDGQFRHVVSRVPRNRRIRSAGPGQRDLKQDSPGPPVRLEFPRIVDSGKAV